MFKRKVELYLEEWVKSPIKKPLILRGARQVGKTSLIKNWTSNTKRNLVYINLENSSERELFKSIQKSDGGIDLKDCLRVIQNYYSIVQDLKNNIIFFDEIQNIPELIPLLRFFYETSPEIPVIS